MSNFQIYLERVRKEDINLSLNNFNNYLEKVRLFSEEKTSLEVIQENPTQYIKKFKNYANNKKLYIDLVVRVAPEKKIQVSLKNEKTILNTITGNEKEFEIDDNTFLKIYDDKRNYKKLEKVKKELGVSGKNVANLKEKYKSSNMVFVLSVDKLYKDYLEEYFLYRHQIIAKFSGLKEKEIEIRNSVVELKIENIKYDTDKVNFELSLNE